MRKYRNVLQQKVTIRCESGKDHDAKRTIVSTVMKINKQEQ